MTGRAISSSAARRAIGPISVPPSPRPPRTAAACCPCAPLPWRHYGGLLGRFARAHAFISVDLDERELKHVNIDQVEEAYQKRRSVPAEPPGGAGDLSGCRAGRRCAAAARDGAEVALIAVKCGAEGVVAPRRRIACRDAHSRSPYRFCRRHRCRRHLCGRALVGFTRPAAHSMRCCSAPSRRPSASRPGLRSCLCHAGRGAPAHGSPATMRRFLSRLVPKPLRSTVQNEKAVMLGNCHAA